jgi:sphingomyelin phosphodiesterase
MLAFSSIMLLFLNHLVLCSKDSLVHREGNQRQLINASTISDIMKIFSKIEKSPIAEHFSNGIKAGVACNLCNILFSMFGNHAVSPEVIIFGLKLICIAQMKETNICFQVIDMHRDVITFIKSNSSLTKYEMCAIILDDTCLWDTHEIEGHSNPNIYWETPLTGKESHPISRLGLLLLLQLSKGILKRKDIEVRKQIRADDFVEESFKIIHITDIHIDLDYTPGNNAVCGQPMCCTLDNGPAPSPESAAGVMGDYRSCDAPLGLLKAALDNMERLHGDADLLLWTGDNIPHLGWMLRQEDIKKSLIASTRLFQAFHDRTGIAIIPIIGNHETVPINQLSTHNSSVSSQWIFDFTSVIWSNLLKSKKSKSFSNEIKHAWKSHHFKFGNFKVKLSKKLVLLSINSMFCMRLNFVNLVNPIDPANVLSYLAKELNDAEMNGYKVILVMHVPPGPLDCYQSWIYNFIRIIERYQETIQLQLAGHMHNDEFKVYMSQGKDKTVPVGLVLAAPSLTPFSGGNPSYRVLHVDKTTGRPFHYETYYVNLTEANERAVYDFKLNYEAKSFFGVDSISAKEFHSLISRLKSNGTFSDSFIRQVFRSHSPHDIDSYLTQDSKREILDNLKVQDAFHTMNNHQFINTIFNKGFKGL